MKKIIITGATGFIGVHLIKNWLEQDVEIYAVIRPHSKNAARIPRNSKVHVIELSMKEINKLSNIIDSADCFYHLAWEGARAPFRDDVNMQKNNYECALQAYETAKKMGCSFFLGSGSQAEYGLTNGLVDENYPCNPTTEYGKQKLNASRELLKRANNDGIKLIWTRIFSIYGPYDYPGTLIMTCIEKMKSNEPVELTQCTQLWDYLYVEDAARAMMLFAEKECESGVYIIASGEYRPLREYVEEIKRILGSSSILSFGAVPYGAQGPVNLTPNPEKTKKVLNWEVKHPFSENIDKMTKEANFLNIPVR